MALISGTMSWRARTFLPSPARRILENTLTNAESTASLSEPSARLRRSPDGPWLGLFVLVTAYVVVLGWLTLRQQARFGTFGFDMGIHDQGIWLLSQGERPFVTVRGLHYLGHHLNLVSVLFVPAYWLGAGPSFLYVVETLAL